MTKLPRGLSGRQVRRALERAGFYLKRQKGSHMVLRRDSPFAQVIVPTHASVDTGTLAAIPNQPASLRMTSECSSNAVGVRIEDLPLPLRSSAAATR